ncbi:hypothetical protein C5S36_05420 [Candidatus Methanophagaceae archaeon]|nr:hypothetical protein C5S36_05420 [Methanophagales archaeon]
MQNMKLVRTVSGLEDDRISLRVIALALAFYPHFFARMPSIGNVGISIISYYEKGIRGNS